MLDAAQTAIVMRIVMLVSLQQGAHNDFLAVALASCFKLLSTDLPRITISIAMAMSPSRPK